MSRHIRRTLIPRKVVLHVGDCRDVLATLPDNSVDSVVCDPPYHLTMVKRLRNSNVRDVAKNFTKTIPGQGTNPFRSAARGFMGKKWDGGDIAFQHTMWAEVLRVLKPGGHLLAFGGTRTYHRMACAIEDAGFEIRDMAGWLYGCLDSATQVATYAGVKNYTDVVVGELVLCYDASTKTYSYQPVQEVVEYDYDDTAYRIVGDFGEQIVSRNHRCIIEQDGIEIFRLAEEIARERETRVPVLESLSDLQQAFSNFQSGAQAVRAWVGHKTSVVRVLPFRYVGKVWCLRVPTGAFVAVRGGVAFPTGNSGFPKNLNVSKAIDKMAGAKREVMYVNKAVLRRATGAKSGELKKSWVTSDSAIVFKNRWVTSDNGATVTAPATKEAKQWDGWGTALKPAIEPICVARKPLSEKNVVANVLKWGTGAINIDGSRVATDSAVDDPRLYGKGKWNTGGMAKNVYGGFAGKETTSSPKGRFPANIMHDGSTEVESIFQYSKSGALTSKQQLNGGFSGAKHIYGTAKPNTACRTDYPPNEGSAARFFYSAKANQSDRLGSIHPTIKPIKLMRYLVRLVTPPGGIVLDPFAGTGTTGEAAFLEGFRARLIEKEIPHARDIIRRMKTIPNRYRQNRVQKTTRSENAVVKKTLFDTPRKPKRR